MKNNGLIEMDGQCAAGSPCAELIDRVARFTPDAGIHTSPIESLHLIRQLEPSEEACTLYEPSVCIVVQGRKRVQLGSESVVYDPLNVLVVSVTMPVVAQVLEASPDKPFLCLRLDFDPREIAALMLDMRMSVPGAGQAQRGLQLAPTSGPLLDAVLRLMRALDNDSDVRVLAPLILREILYRLLTGELGPCLCEMAVADSRAHRIARAVDILKRRYDEAIRIEELASSVNMSASSLHQHFKSVTTMSPLQFQKQLRLHEARRLMLVEGLEAAAACHRVGYESPSQFSREYRRLFGVPPRREISRLRESGDSHTEAA